MPRDLDDILEDLARHPCGELLSIARRALRSGSGSVVIPLVKGEVRIAIRERMPKKYADANGTFLSGRIRLLRRRGMLWTLVHEMRHAQQLAILGKGEFYYWTRMAQGSLVLWSPLEVDAKAAEIVAGNDPNKWFREHFRKSSASALYDKKFRKQMDGILYVLDRAYRSHARVIGGKASSLSTRRRDVSKKSRKIDR